MDQGKPSFNLLDQQLSESGLEMQIWGAIAGVATSIIGGMQQQSASDKANKQAKKQAKEQYEHAKKVYKVQQENNKVQSEFTDSTNLQNWKYTIDQQQFKYGTELLAKIESDKTLGKQLEYNQQATTLANKQQDHWLFDQELDREFTLAEIEIGKTTSGDSLVNSYKDILNNANNQRQNIFAQQAAAQYERNNELAKTAFESTDNMVNSLLAGGKAALGGAGRSKVAVADSAEKAGGRKEAELKYQAQNILNLAAVNMNKLHHDLLFTNNNARISKERVGRKYVNEMSSFANATSKAEATWKSAKRKDGLNRMEILLSKKQQDMNAYANNLMMPIMGPTPPPPFATPIPKLVEPSKFSAAQVSSPGILGGIVSSLPGLVSGFASMGKTPTSYSGFGSNNSVQYNGSMSWMGG